MKKKNLIFIFILLLILPSFVLADGGCTTPVIKGEGGSEKGDSTGKGCSDTVCVAISSHKYRGVRVQIYKYNGSGNTGDIRLVGKGVDIWSTNELRSDNYYFSSPSTPNLKYKSTCTKADGSNTYGNNANTIYPLTSSQYLSGDYGTISYDDSGQDSIKAKLKSGNVNDYLLRKNSNGEPTGGWIYDNIFIHLKNNTNASRSSLKSLFSLTDADIDDMLANSEDYYITAEILYRFHVRTDGYSSFNLKSGYWYLGTVSEAGYFHGHSFEYIALQSVNENVGKLVSNENNPNDSFLIWRRDDFNVREYMNNTTTNAENYWAACNSTYGYAVWNISMCGECSKNNCTKTCSKENGYYPGTDELKDCAEKYCNTLTPDKDEYGKDYSTCYNSCYKPPSTCKADCADLDDFDLNICATQWCSKNAPEDANCVPDCTNPEKPDCLTTCGGNDHACAVNWCNANEDPSDVESCINFCYTELPTPSTPETPTLPTGSGCPSGGDICTPDPIMVKTKTCSTTSSDSETLASNYCVDDSKSYDEIKQVFYRVECDEELKISDLPTSSRVNIGETGTASLYLGYTLDYTKTCNLYWKKANTSGQWITNTNVGTEIVNYYNKLIDYREKALNDIETAKAAYESAEESYNKTYLKLYGDTQTVYCCEGTNSNICPTTLCSNVVCPYGYEKKSSSIPGIRNCILKGYYELEDEELEKCNEKEGEEKEKCENDTIDKYDEYINNAKEAMDKAQEIMDKQSDKITELESKISDYEEQMREIYGSTLPDPLRKITSSEEEEFLKETVVYRAAQEKLKEVSERDTKDGNVIYTSADIWVYVENQTDTTKKSVKMIPVSCVETAADQKYCTLVNGEEFQWEEMTSGSVVCENEDGEPITATVEEFSSEYSKRIYYGLPSSWIESLTEDAGTVYHDEQSCLNAVKDVDGECIEKENVWVFDPIDKSVSILDYINSHTEGKYRMSISNYGLCGQFQFEYNCPYKFDTYSVCANECLKYDYGSSEYEQCFKENCSCDTYCGSNVMCRAMYCPQECDGCEWDLKGTCPEPKPSCINNCNSVSGGNTSSEKYLTCLYDSCCSAECNGEAGCLYGCCASECSAKRDAGLLSNSEYEACLQTCGDINLCTGDDCGNDYIYRTINMNSPFPGGRDPGRNWRTKVEYITRSEEPTTRYYDSTSGRNTDDDNYEYEIKLTSKVVRNVRNKYQKETTYTTFNRTTSVSSNKGKGAYCSALLHEEEGFTSQGVKISIHADSGSGCE